jgi:hypothetical protein
MASHGIIPFKMATLTVGTEKFAALCGVAGFQPRTAALQSSARPLSHLTFK